MSLYTEELMHAQTHTQDVLVHRLTGFEVDTDSHESSQEQTGFRETLNLSIHIKSYA
jgi:hypothetical protein